MAMSLEKVAIVNELKVRRIDAKGRNEREEKREITNRNLTVQEIDNTKEPQKKKIREKVKHVKKKKKAEGKNENALSSFSTVNRILEAVRTH